MTIVNRETIYGDRKERNHLSSISCFCPDGNIDLVWTVIGPIIILVLLVMVNFCAPTKTYADTMDVPLTVTNQADYERTDAYITGGIPLSREWGIVDTADLRVIDEDGHPLPAQFRVTGRWAGGPESSGPIKWVLATFSATVPPRSDKIFYLTTGSNIPPSSTLRIEEDTQDRLVINTGTGIFTLDKTAFDLFHDVRIGSQQVVTTSSNNGFFLVSKDGQTFSSVYDAPHKFVIENKGPLYLTVRVEGKLRNVDGVSLADYTVWLTFYAGNNTVRVLYTLGNHKQAKVKGTSYDVYDYYGGNSTTFKSAGVRLGLSGGTSPVRFLVPGGDRFENGEVAGLSIYQDSSGTDYWNRYDSSDHPRPNSYVAFRGYRVENGGRLVSSGDHYDGWVDCGDDIKGITLAVTDFWQNYPKGFSCTADGTVAVDLFPDHYDGDYNFRVGEEKTIEMWFRFHLQNENPTELSEKARELLDPLRAWAAPKWYADSGALPPFAAAPGDLEGRLGRADQLNDYGKYEYFNDRTLIRDPQDDVHTYYPFHSLWLSGNGSPSAVDYFNFYGWNAYGNQPLDFEMYDDGKAGYFNSKYDFNWGAWIQFLRTGDQRWQTMAEAFSRHLEQIMLHDVATETGYDIYRWKNALFGHAEHNEPGNRNGTRNYLGPVMDTAWGVRGALLHYHLTGYPPSLRFALDAAEYAYNFYLDRFESDYLWEGYERYAGNLLSILTEAWEFTGDAKYSQLARRLMDHYAPELQPYINGPIDSDAFTMPWMMGLYLSAMGRYARVADEYGAAEESRVAKERLAAFADWLCDNVIIECRGWTTVNYRYNVNGFNDPDEGIFSNWLLDLADSLTYAYKFTNDMDYLQTARRLFATAVNNPSYEQSPLDYFTVKEAVNHAVFGHVFLAESTRLDNDGGQFIDGNSGDDGDDDDGGNGDDSGDGTWTHPYEEEMLLNGEANEGLNYWNTWYATADVVYFDGDPCFSVEQGYLFQDIDLQDFDGIKTGDATVVISARMKAGSDEGKSGKPYLYGYLFGTADNPNRINTYIRTEPVWGSSWETKTASYPVPPETTKIRLFLKITQMRAAGAADQSAYFDSISVQLTLAGRTVAELPAMADTTITLAAPDGNYGASDELIVYNGATPAYRSLLAFDLSSIPCQHQIEKAELFLYCSETQAVINRIYRMTSSWTEGSGTYGNTQDGATWNTRDGVNPWAVPGGDFDTRSDYGNGPNGIVAQLVPVPGRVLFDVTAAVAAQCAEQDSILRLALVIPDQYYYLVTRYLSRESNIQDSSPCLSVRYSTDETTEDVD